jgi:3-phosphoshikimate 1-carboxyvinyltransferase
MKALNYRISHPTKKLLGTIELTASKSESNRALIIQAMCEDKFEIKNLAKAQDTIIMQQILNSNDTASVKFDTGQAGTVMRFLTAYFATKPGKRILTGSDRMKKRPMGILVDALRQLGAKINYLEEEGFAPLEIEGTVLKGGEIEIDGSVSSQFISALLLIAPALQNGLVIKFNGRVTSRPYINMTLKMMEEFRVYGIWHANSISVSKQNYHRKSEEDYAYMIEGDWSAASYWYALAALSEETDLTIKGLKNPSLQGDAIVADVFTFFGVKTEYIEDGIRLSKMRIKDELFGFDFSDCPDIAQTVAITCGALQIPAFFNGLDTLRIKETDRLIALKNEMKKMGVEVNIVGDNTIKILPTESIHQPDPINTYDDHRMAMAFACLAMKFDSITIEQPDVVKKSYPGFWSDLKKVGFVVEEVQTNL